jgi:hypothetical protein
MPLSLKVSSPLGPDHIEGRRASYSWKSLRLPVPLLVRRGYHDSDEFRFAYVEQGLIFGGRLVNEETPLLSGSIMMLRVSPVPRSKAPGEDFPCVTVFYKSFYLILAG